MKKFFIVLIVAVLTFLLFSNTNATSNKIEVWGILRPDSQGQWYLLNDTDHVPQGISSITQTSTYIRVNHSCFSKIYTGYADPDETLVMNNVDSGFGAGLCYSIIFLAKNGSAVNPNTINYSGSNIWFYLTGLDA